MCVCLTTLKHTTAKNKQIKQNSAVTNNLDVMKNNVSQNKSEIDALKNNVSQNVREINQKYTNGLHFLPKTQIFFVFD